MKIRVGVFFGGRSVEHEVSVISGLQAYNAFDREKYEPVPIYITKENELYTGELIADIANYKNIPELLKKSTRVFMMCEQNGVKLIQYPEKKFGSSEAAQIDVAFPVVHGANVEDGSLQGFLRHYNIPIAGCDVTASAVTMDKYVMKTVLKDNGIPVLDCVTLYGKEYESNEECALAKVEEKSGYRKACQFRLQRGDQSSQRQGGAARSFGVCFYLWAKSACGARDHESSGDQLRGSRRL